MSTTPLGSPFRGARIALLTNHGKERVIAPPFAERLGAEITLATGFDTDSFGTFTREVARRGSQLEAARAKAEKGMDLLGLDYGVASEGAFGPAPFGFVSWNVELVVLVDRTRRIEIVGQAQGAACHLHGQVTTREALETFARRAGFPEHGLVVRPNDERDPRLHKGIADWSTLDACFEAAKAQSRSSCVFVENDLRAHLNPTRMRMIREATDDLVTRILSPCPICTLPGFGLRQRLPGLPCRDCGSPTDEARAERWVCVGEEHTETRDVEPGRLADPFRCNRCNP